MSGPYPFPRLPTPRSVPLSRTHVCVLAVQNGEVVVVVVG